MKLPDAQRADLHRRARLAGEPDRVQAALAGPALWRHLPAILLDEVQHEPIPLSVLTGEDFFINLPRGIGALLAWLALTIRPLNRTQATHLRAIAQRIFEASPGYPLHGGILGATGPPGAAFDAASALPRAWREELFARQKLTSRLAALLRDWTYFPPGFVGSASISACLKHAHLDYLYSFSLVPVDVLLKVHDAMVAWQLWNDLELSTALGQPYIGSAQELSVSNQLSAPRGDLHTLLCTNVTDLSLAADLDMELRRGDCRDAANRVDLALRLFELPDLAARVFERSRAEIEDALRAVAPIVGHLSVRFPLASPSCPPTNPRSS